MAKFFQDFLAHLIAGLCVFIIALFVCACCEVKVSEETHLPVVTIKHSADANPHSVGEGN